MTPVTRDDLKNIFKKVKKLHLTDGLEEADFSTLSYYSWTDESSQRLYLVTDYKGALTGIKLEFLRAGPAPLRLGFCEFCHKHRKSNEVLFVAAETKKRPKKVNYRSRGTWVCGDYRRCNKDLKGSEFVNKFFYRIVEEV
jgi:hypothetical protein